MPDTATAPSPATRELHPQLFAPSLVYLTGEDVVRVTSWCSLAGVKLTVNLRILTPQNLIQVVPATHTPNSDRSAATSDLNPCEGWLLGASVTATTGTPSRGQCFVALRLARGFGSAAIEIATLAADFVTSQQRMAYPSSGVRSSVEGPGFLRSFTGTDPAANTEVSETVPTGARWRLQSMFVQLVTDANVANRSVQLVIDDGANIIYRGHAATSQTASLTFPYCFSPNGAPMVGSVNNCPQICTPVGLILPAGSRIRTITANLQATDNYGAPQLSVEEWPEAA